MSTPGLWNLPTQRDPIGVASPANRLDGTIVTVDRYAAVVEIGIACGPYRSCR
jgi:hypothetical protein